jgi:hypothetical protein
LRERRICAMSAATPPAWQIFSAFATACERVPQAVVLLVLLAAELMLAELSVCALERLKLLLMPPAPPAAAMERGVCCAVERGVGLALLVLLRLRRHNLGVAHFFAPQSAR